MFVNKQSGFTLIEIAVVLVIVGMLVGSFIGSITQRIETTRRDNAKKQLEDIKTALLGFASVQGRLPCPTTASGAGQEQPASGTGLCTVQHGFVPGRTLGINGSYNRDILLIDSWGNPFRYSVTDTNANAFTKPSGIKDTTMAVLESPAFPDFVICDRASTAATSCSAGVNTLINSTPFIVLSLGKDGSNFAGAIAPNTNQGENSGEFLVAANAAGENIAYTVGNNTVFTKMSYSGVGSTAGLFDDIIVWVSSYVLYSRMIETGQLPGT